jgi:V8-like Glu-specific endopeptidase
MKEILELIGKDGYFFDPDEKAVNFESDTPAERVVDVKTRGPEFEEYVGVPTFLPIHFLSVGALRSAAVCKLSVPMNGKTFNGTGFLYELEITDKISHAMLMTNNHVIPDADSAKGAIATFFLEDGEPKSFDTTLNAGVFKTSHKDELDVTVVACVLTEELKKEFKNRHVQAISLSKFSEARVGKAVNIIQHPIGNPKVVVVHQNKIIQVTEKTLVYEADTNGGSSGSPVFDNEWALVGLHHKGEIRNKKAQNIGILIQAIITWLNSDPNPKPTK